VDWADDPTRTGYCAMHSNQSIIISRLLCHSNQVIIFPYLQKRAQCTFCMQGNESENRDEGERVTWNGGAQGAGLTVACGGGGVVVAVDGCGSRQ
jgi:hypothetical protein